MGVYGFISKERSSLWKNALQTSVPMSSTLEGHRNQGEPIIGIPSFCSQRLVQGWSCDTGQMTWSCGARHFTVKPMEKHPFLMDRSAVRIQTWQLCPLRHRLVWIKAIHEKEKVEKSNSYTESEILGSLLGFTHPDFLTLTQFCQFPVCLSRPSLHLSPQLNHW